MSTRINITLDNRALKDKAKQVYNNLGMSLSTAVNVFLKQSVKDNRLPFQPTNEPIASVMARKELKHPEKLKSYKSVDDMWKDITK